MNLNNNYQAVSAAEAVSIIKSNTTLFVHTAGASPQTLVKALADRADELKNVKIYQMHTEGQAPYADPALKDSFRVKNLFIGGNTRRAVYRPPMCATH